MKTEIEKLTNSIQKKVGKDSAGKIADDLASLLSLSSKADDDLKSRDDEIVKLKSDKEMLITANGNLLQQIGSVEESELLPKEEKEVKKSVVDVRSFFDSKGKFIK